MAKAAMQQGMDVGLHAGMEIERLCYAQVCRMKGKSVEDITSRLHHMAALTKYAYLVVRASAESCLLCVEDLLKRRDGGGRGWMDGLMNHHTHTQVIPTQDRLEGLRAFKEKRKPLYTGK